MMNLFFFLNEILKVNYRFCERNNNSEILWAFRAD